MNCLTNEQMTRLVLGLTEDAALIAHVERCPACQTNLAAVRALHETFATAHRSLQRGHEAARARFMAALAKEDRPAEQVGTWRRRTLRLGAITMRQRIAVGSVGLAVILGVLVLWNTATPVSALAKMAENIRQAKSYKATSVGGREIVLKTGTPPVMAVLTSTNYWLAPGSSRGETKGDKNWGYKDELGISPAGKPGIDIDHRLKVYRRTPAKLGYILPLTKLAELGNFSGQADRELGEREINGRRAAGFEIDISKIDPDGGSGRLQVWVDRETNWPVLVRWDIEMFGSRMTNTMQDFQWNIDLDPTLFDPTPPVGYTDETTPAPSPEEQVRVLTEGFKLYSELSGGHYPRGKMVYGDVTWSEMLNMIGIAGQPTEEQMRSDAYQKIEQVHSFFPTIFGVLVNNLDAVYYGKTVGPKDAKKVLLRWQVEDDKYQVMFGDLRAEIVTAERLRALEGK